MEPLGLIISYLGEAALVPLDEERDSKLLDLIFDNACFNVVAYDMYDLKIHQHFKQVKTYIKFPIDNNTYLKDIINVSNIVELNLAGNVTIDSIPFTNLLHLNIGGNVLITDDMLKLLIHLISLNLENNNLITDEGIKNMYQLERLNLDDTFNIEKISHLKTLNVLYLYNNGGIEDEELKQLSSLTYLDLGENTLVTIESLSSLDKLQGLVLHH